jgi:hypothetical protein
MHIQYTNGDDWGKGHFILVCAAHTLYDMVTKAKQGERKKAEFFLPVQGYNQEVGSQNK